jgi:ubiquinone/menaquinone biosynthesis C-methylase UbiE
MEQTDPNYEYQGMMAQAWDLLRGDTSNWEDRFFYKEVVRGSGQPVLDVGCGTGRLLLDFLQDGVDADGVDNSPDMLALCREKAGKLGLQPNLYRQTMQDLDLPRKYRTIIVPSSSFQLLVDPADAAEAMRRFYDHLEPGGTLAMPFMILWSESDDQEVFDREGDLLSYKEWKVLGEATRPEDGVRVRRWGHARFDIANQLEHTEDRYELLRGGEVIATEHHSRSPATRWYTQQQAVDLYRQAGFTGIHVVKIFDLDFTPASESDTYFSVLGTRG